MICTYITGSEIDLKNLSNGVSKKINYQINLLNNSGIKCTWHPLEKGRFNDNLFYKIIWALPFSNFNPIWEITDEILKSDLVYIRKPLFFNFASIVFFKKLKKKNIHIILEIPTFPYNKEYIGLGRILLFKDLFYRNFLHKYIDKVFYMSEKEEQSKIWGISATHLINGIDLSDEKLAKNINHSSLNLLCVSSCYYWHGYDRLIKGLELYYDNNPCDNVHVYIVGEGPEIPLYKRLTEKGGLQEKVHFCGYKSGKELDELYSIADICIGSLGIHRKGFYITSELKSRESFAKGIPFACAGKLDVTLIKQTDYFLELPCDDNPINIQDLILFYKKIYCKKDKNEVAISIRDYALDNMDIKHTMAPIIDYINSIK